VRNLVDNVLRAVALVVTDRRWAAPLSAMALGFGLFLGVAIGPGAAGGLATGAGQIIAVAEPSSAAGDGEPEEAAREVEEPFAEQESSGGEESYEAASEYATPSHESEPAPAEEEEAPESEPAEEEEAEEATEAQVFAGTVVHLNPAAESYAIGLPGGELVSIHSEKPPALGTKLSAEAEPLGNSTFDELDRKRSGAATAATIRGVVTHVDPDPADPAYTVSGRGSSLLVHAAAAEQPDLPELGAYVEVEVGIEKAAEDGEAGEATDAAATETSEAEAEGSCVADPELETPAAPAHRLVERKREAEPEPAVYVDLAGIVSAVCPRSGELLISADDVRDSGADLVLTVPKKLKTAKLTVGDSVLATAELDADGTLTLAGLAGDEGAKGAADDSTAQGDLAR
jgi:hypothetical protein